MKPQHGLKIKGQFSVTGGNSSIAGQLQHHLILSHRRLVKFDQWHNFILSKLKMKCLHSGSAIITGACQQKYPKEEEKEEDEEEDKKKALAVWKGPNPHGNFRRIVIDA